MPILLYYKNYYVGDDAVRNAVGQVEVVLCVQLVIHDLLVSEVYGVKQQKYNADKDDQLATYLKLVHVAKTMPAKT
jgi:hypothetical protein